MRTKLFLLVFAVLALTASAVLAGGAPKVKGESAFARFEISHPNGCTVTTASVFVFDNNAFKPGDPPANEPRVEFIYRVLGQPTDPGCDALFYYDLHGSAPLDKRDFSVSGGLKAATLNKTFQVFDEEAFVFLDVTINVEWVATGELTGSVRPAVATLSVSSPSLSPLYIVNPLSPSTIAEIARLP